MSTDAICFHLNRAINAKAEAWRHALALTYLAPDTDLGDVLDSVYVLSHNVTAEQPSDLTEEQVAELLAKWQTISRRRSAAKRLRV